MFKVSSIHLLSKTRLSFKIYFTQLRFHITTWSALGNAFNTRPVWKPNYSLTQGDVGLFKIPQLRDASGFYLLKDRVANRTEYLVDESCNPKRKRKMVNIFDELSDTLCRVADMAEFIRIAHPQAKYVTAADYACSQISNLVEELNTNREMYQALKTVVEKGDTYPTDEIDDHVAKLFLFDFEQSGIHLDDERRQKVLQLNEQILQQGSFFMHNCHIPRVIPKEKVPADILKLFSVEGDSVRVGGLHADSNIEEVREAAYKVYLHPDEHQEELLSNLLKARHELAQLCGFPTYAHRTLCNSLAGSPSNVANFLDQTSKAVRHPAQQNFDEMRSAKLLGNNFTSLELKPWDVPYYTALIKDEKYQIHIPDYTDYLSLGACMEGLNTLLQALFQVDLRPLQPEPGEVWHTDVYKLGVMHMEEGLLGYIYCDFFDRAGKLNQDCHFTIQGGRRLEDGSYQLPVVVLLLNFPQPTENRPSLLTPGMVENLFHEMGHAMHSMLGRTKHQHVTGTRCSTDFAEVPSILMEKFANDPRVLSTFTRHYKTGEAISDEMLNRLCDSRSLFNASETQLQLFYSAVDQIFHTKPLGDKTTTQVVAAVQDDYYSLPYEPGTAWQLRFSHLVGYGAKYYSYLMARAVASLIWQHGFQEDPFNRKMGLKYRQDILSHGGGRPPKELIEAFLGKEVTPELLTKALIAEINECDNS